MMFSLGVATGAALVVGAIVSINIMFEMADRRHRD
jgi:hypothetical protein